MDQLTQQQETETEVVTPPETEETTALETTEGEQAPEAQKVEPVEDVETLKKRLADTQAWAHQRNQRALELEKQQEQQRLKQIQEGVTPEVLSVVNHAIEAREIQARQEQARKNDEVLRAVHEVEPEIDALNQNPVFTQALNEQAEKLIASGKDPLNPIFAVKAVLEAKRQFDMSQARTSAEAAERARKTSKMAAMNVPGSGAAAPANKGKSPEDEAAAVWNMSAEDFAKLKLKARGF